MSVTAPKWIDSWERLQFRFFLKLFSCLLTTNLSRTNNRSRAGRQTLSKERQQTVNPHYITRLFMLFCCYQRCSLDRDRMPMTRFSFYDHDATQAECAHRLLLCTTTSRATSGGWRKDRNTSGQRVNKFKTSYRDISVIVAENNSLLKPKCQQYTSLNKMLRNFSKVLMAHISFTAVINNRGIGGIRKGTKKNYIYVL